MRRFNCITCGELKPVDAYYRRRDGLQRRFTECKECCKARKRRWAKTHPEERRRQGRVEAARFRLRNPEKLLLTRARGRARQLGLEFDLAVDDLRPLPSVCPALGIPLTPPGGGGASLSIDRIDNTRGYVRGNVVIVSLRANRLKNNATVDELVKIARFYEALTSGHVAGPVGIDSALKQHRP
jgi:hypothetical protein